MVLLIRFHRLYARSVRRCSGWQYSLLPGRRLLEVTGADHIEFLQDMLTCDVLDSRSSLYGALLDARGRIRYDMLLYKTNESMLLDVQADRAEILGRELRMYKMRKSVDVRLLEVCSVLALFPKPSFAPEFMDLPRPYIDALSKSPNVIATVDPRTSLLGYRIIATGTNLEQVESILSDVHCVESDHYTVHKYMHGIPEGAVELPTAKAMPLESNMDYLNGVSFDKGCYLGQELTARTHHTGVVRKRIMPIKSTDGTDLSQIPPDTNILAANSTVNKQVTVGRLRAGFQNYGVALLRVEPALKADSLILDGSRIRTWKPMWWHS